MLACHSCRKQEVSLEMKYLTYAIILHSESKVESGAAKQQHQLNITQAKPCVPRVQKTTLILRPHSSYCSCQIAGHDCSWSTITYVSPQLHFVDVRGGCLNMSALVVSLFKSNRRFHNGRSEEDVSWGDGQREFLKKMAPLHLDNVSRWIHSSMMGNELNTS